MHLGSLAMLICLPVVAAGCGWIESRGGPAQPALAGVYRATLPCEDCRGTDTELKLVSDQPGAAIGSYNMWENYIGRGEPPVFSTGRWATDRGAGEYQGETVYRLESEQPESARSFLRLESGSLQLIAERELPGDPYLDYALVLRGVGLPNAAGVHCIHHGGIAQVRRDGKGGVAGICVLADGRECDEWPLYREGVCVREGGSSIPVAARE